MMKKVKFRSNISKIFAVIMAFCVCLTCMVTANAAVSTGSTGRTTASVSSDESSESATVTKPVDDVTDEDEAKKDYSWSTNTIGNSELIANEEILLDNGYYQFIAVTTRDDDVFYVIIDETKTEDNVYFLNEVDTYDINKLLSDGDTNTSSNTGAGSEISTEEPAATEETSVSPENTSSSGNSQFYIILLIGIVALAAVGFAIYKLKGKKKTPQNNENFDDFDFEEDEINEDDENKDGNKE